VKAGKRSRPWAEKTKKINKTIDEYTSKRNHSQDLDEFMEEDDE